MDEKTRRGRVGSVARTRGRERKRKRGRSVSEGEIDTRRRADSASAETNTSRHEEIGKERCEIEEEISLVAVPAKLLRPPN
ncbi:hypothetical protein PUN28_016061 [Cardiocondyla obscurior]|uniref:Uncharacterized protein n=1 Tax=Cardiocondyla obscurior TaxID=286306 RepID=A0AAW2ET63_9HYME